MDRAQWDDHRASKNNITVWRGKHDTRCRKASPPMQLKIMGCMNTQHALYGPTPMLGARVWPAFYEVSSNDSPIGPFVQLESWSTTKRFNYSSVLERPPQVGATFYGKANNEDLPRAGPTVLEVPPPKRWQRK